jgi:hypothetical protein
MAASLEVGQLKEWVVGVVGSVPDGKDVSRHC